MANIEKKAVETVAGLMALSARTAPKGKGQDALVTRVLVGDEVKEMRSKYQEVCYSFDTVK